MGYDTHPPLEKFKSGATSSKLDEAYELICPAAQRRLARRHALGMKQHSAYGWCKASDDPLFRAHRIRHTIMHLFAYLKEGNTRDDNLAAAMWGVACEIHFEEKCKHHLAPWISYSDGDKDLELVRAQYDRERVGMQPRGKVEGNRLFWKTPSEEATAKLNLEILLAGGVTFIEDMGLDQYQAKLREYYKALKHNEVRVL